MKKVRSLDTSGPLEFLYSLLQFLAKKLWVPEPTPKTFMRSCEPAEPTPMERLTKYIICFEEFFTTEYG